MVVDALPGSNGSNSPSLPAAGQPRKRTPVRRLVAGAALALLVSGCSIERFAVRKMGEVLAGSGDLFAGDPDPELVRDALPFALKTIEALIAKAPGDRGLLLAACQGFAGYAWAFPDTDAVLIEAEDGPRAAALRQRAKGLYLRARDYGLRALELAHPGLTDRLRRDPNPAVAALTVADAELVYWVAASWGGAIGVGKDDPGLLGDLGVVRALLLRVVELDETAAAGAAHEALIQLAALRELGGSPATARRHFARAVELAGDRRPGPYVALASAVAVPAQDREEFTALLATALAKDPDAEPSQRLVGRITQTRARFLLSRVDELFLPPLDDPDEDSGELSSASPAEEPVGGPTAPSQEIR